MKNLNKMGRNPCRLHPIVSSYSTLACMDKEKDLCKHFGVQALPTLFFIPVGGKPIVEVGATPEKYVQIIEEQLLK